MESLVDIFKMSLKVFFIEFLQQFFVFQAKPRKTSIDELLVKSFQQTFIFLIEFCFVSSREQSKISEKNIEMLLEKFLVEKGCKEFKYEFKRDYRIV